MSEKVIKLPVGQLDAMGTKIIDEATITEFTAKVYKELGKRTNQQNAETVEDVILKNCVVAIGEKRILLHLISPAYLRQIEII